MKIFVIKRHWRRTSLIEHIANIEADNKEEAQAEAAKIFFQYLVSVDEDIVNNQLPTYRVLKIGDRVEYFQGSKDSLINKIGCIEEAPDVAGISMVKFETGSLSCHISNLKLENA